LRGDGARESDGWRSRDKYPIRGIFVGCCAWANGAVISKTVVNNQTKIFPLIWFRSRVIADN